MKNEVNRVLAAKKKIFLFMALCLMAVTGAKAATPNEVYTVFDGDTTLTYYYDDQRSSRTGEVELYDPVNNPNATRFSAYYDKIKRIVISPSMKNANLTSMVRMFYDGKFGLPVSNIEGLANLNTENVEYMDVLFFKCSKLKKLDLSTFDTRKVKGMKSMFFGCEALDSLNISTFRTSNVSDMSYMFYGCKALKELDIMSFDISKVTIASNMFKSCSSLTTIYCVDDWSASTELITSSDMFDGCTVLQGGNKTQYNNSNPKDKTYAHLDEAGNPGYFSYKEYAALEADGKTMTIYYDGNMVGRNGKTSDQWSAWKDVVTKVVFNESVKDAKPTSTFDWFHGFKALESIEHLDYLNTEDVTDMSRMFYNCQKLASLDVSHFKTENVTDMSEMFSLCNALTSLDVSNFKTEKVTTMKGMFNDCRALTSLDLSHFNTENVTNMETMFYGCSALTSLNISNFKTEKVTTMWGMFFYCKALTSLDVSHFNTENVTTMGSMFGFCETLTALDVSKLNTEKVTIMSNMFRGCSSIKELDISHFNTSSLTSTDFMFEGCTALKTIWCNGRWSNSSLLTNSTNMFDGCTSLQGGRGTRYHDYSSKDKTFAHPDSYTHGGYFSATGEPEIYALMTSTAMFILYDNTRWMNTSVPCANDWWKNDDFWSWAGKQKKDVTKVVFDESVKKAKPTSTAQWFQDFLNLETIEHLDYLNTEEVTEMNTMFSCCHLLKTLDLSHFKTNKVKNMGLMFYYCDGLESLDLSSFKTDSLRDMYMMFQLCSGLESLDLSSFNVDSANCMFLFQNCTSLKSLNLEGWNLCEKGWSPNMFLGCSSLETIYCSNTWRVSDGGYGGDMFAGCTKLKGCLGTAYDAEHTDVAYAHPDGGTKNPGYFTGTFKVTLQAEHGNIGVQENVDLNKVTPGTTLHLDVTATDEGYEFDKWENYSPALGLNVISDTTVTAIFKAQMFTVRFVDWDQTSLKQESVAYGSSATPPADPTREGYTFTGWDTDEWQNVKRDLQVYATYKKGEGLEETESGKRKTEKVLIDGQIYLMYNGTMYDVQGQKVEK